MVSETKIFRACALAAIAAVWGLAILAPNAADTFRPYFGSLPPVFVVIPIVAVALGTTWVFRTNRGFGTKSLPPTISGIGLAAALAALFAAIVIPVDLIWTFPETINVHWPWAFLFYPAIAVVAESAFHLIPLAILLLVTSFASRPANRELLVWLCIVVVALIEPAFQLAFGSTTGESAGLAAFVATHVFAINIAGLLLFWRYGLGAMLMLRASYYLFWHILWGHARLDIMFPA